MLELCALAGTDTLWSLGGCRARRVTRLSDGSQKRCLTPGGQEGYVGNQKAEMFYNIEPVRASSWKVLKV